MFFWDEELVLSKNWPGDELFKLRKSKIWVRHFLLIVTLKQIFDIPSHKNLLISFCNAFISLTEFKENPSKKSIKRTQVQIWNRQNNLLKVRTTYYVTKYKPSMYLPLKNIIHDMPEFKVKCNVEIQDIKYWDLKYTMFLQFYP